ncbi:MAG: M48 family metalloprotease [Thermodesulfobacteriota bacterium]
MAPVNEEYVKNQGMTRRDFLWITSVSVAGALIGCAVNPVTGQKQLMLMSEKQEIELDKQNSPHQFSSDYGASTDKTLNNYVQQVGKRMASLSHRPKMPYSFRAVNATYVNAYAFPGGSIAATRGILVTLENEAELAALLGHEIGHVNARHTAERMSKQLLTSMVLAGVVAYIEAENKNLAPLAAGLGGMGVGMLLASYSRDDEREADALGMEYMVRASHNPNGMVGLMDVLVGISNSKPSAIQKMFATHPMSEERYKTAVNRSRSKYSQQKPAHPLNRERYMDHTASLRKIKDAIENMQNGEKAMASKKFKDAENQFSLALKNAPNDYAGLVMMGKCMLAQNRNEEAERYSQMAKTVNPTEAQAYQIKGMAALQKKDYDSSYAEFTDYEKILPGNPNTIFLKGLSLEGMGNRYKSALEYHRYLKFDTKSAQAQHAYQRLVEWKYIKPTKK